MSSAAVRCVQALAVPEDVRSRWEVLDSTDKLVAGPLIEDASLKAVGEVDGLRAPARRRLGLRGGEKPSPEPATAETRLHPEALQLAAVAPCPAADAGHDPVVLAHEDGQLDFVTKSHGGGRLTAYLRFEEFDVERLRIDPRRGIPQRRPCQASTICSMSDRSSKYDRNDRIFSSRKSATVTPASWTRRPVASNDASSARTNGPV